VTARDPAIDRALAAALGHAPPFSASELAAVERLSIEAGELATLDVVADLPALRSLRVVGCPIVDIGALARTPELQHLELLFTYVDDLAPVLDLAHLRSARVLGAPLSQRCFDDQRPRLVWGSNQRAVELGTRDDWTRSRTAWTAGIRTLAAVFDGVRPICMRPGATAVPLAGSPYTLSLSAQMAVSDDQLHAELVRATPERPELLDLAPHRTFGDAAAARSWIAAAAGALGPQADALRAFVARFPDAVFFREDALVHDAWAYADGRPLPPAVAQVRRVVAGAWADAATELRCDGSELELWFKRPAWIAIEMPGMRDDVDPERFALAFAYDDFATELGVARGTASKPGSPRVRQWRHGSAKPTPMFASVGDFYAHISTLILDDGTRIDARHSGVSA
jgi:hypothetical protein